MFLPSGYSKVDLSAGNSWTNSGSYTSDLVGSSGYAGKYHEAGTYTVVVNVVSNDGAKVAFTLTYNTKWSTSSSGWFATYDTGGGSKQTIDQLVIDATTFKIITWSVEQRFAGHLNLGVVDTSTLVTGNTISRPWPPVWKTANLPISDVSWTVGGSQTIPYKNGNLQVWPVSFTGNANGFWHVGSTHDLGPETDTYSYDHVYGALVAWSASGKYYLQTGTGNWTETYNGSEQLSSSNLNFNVQPVPEFTATAVVAILTTASTLLIVRRRIHQTHRS
jgi:hypothetical protein